MKRLVPSASMLRLAETVLDSPERREKFLSCLMSGELGRPAVVVLRGDSARRPRELPSWVPSWIELPEAETRPGAHPRHATGDWYVLDLSSAFCASPLTLVRERLAGTSAPVVLDLCASPGGKAVMAWRALTPRLLIANETIKGRIPALISNVKRCLLDPCAIVSRDPARLAEELGSIAEVVVVDAPCSGQSLVVKGMAAPGGFHTAAVSMNAKRQRRIIAEARRLVKPGGYLLYSTCTFSKAENEGVIEWFLKKFPEFSGVAVPSLAAHASKHTAVPCYRLFPFEGWGAGGFCCLLKKNAGGSLQASTTLPHLEWNSNRGRDVFENVTEENASVGSNPLPN